ncbi:MAG: hypothetical protein IPO48_02540 [Saprospiraceae bacterium]|nr:hypothetical protein [Saprospiraceae bacterium]
MTTDTDKYQDNDELGLYLTIIESVTVSFSPTRTIAFKIIRPFDHSETVLRWNAGILTFKGVCQCNLELTNEVYEYPEFYRSAILDDSKLLRDTVAKLQGLGKTSKKKLKHYYLYIDQGNKEMEVHIICEAHELTLETETKYLTEFKGLDE